MKSKLKGRGGWLINDFRLTRHKKALCEGYSKKWLGSLSATDYKWLEGFLDYESMGVCHDAALAKQFGVTPDEKRVRWRKAYARRYDAYQFALLKEPLGNTAEDVVTFFDEITSSIATKKGNTTLEALIDEEEQVALDSLSAPLKNKIAVVSVLGASPTQIKALAAECQSELGV